MAATAGAVLSLIMIGAFLTSAALTPSLPPSPDASTLIATILHTLGFHDLATAANISGATPTTIFAPTDTSLLTCPSCSVPLLLQEHSIHGLYPLHFLRRLPFGTKIETLAANRCLTVTASARKVFINGVEITKPDFFNNGLIIVHGLQGFVAHLSPLSCTVESMTTLSFPQQPSPTAALRLMLKDAMTWLRLNGYSAVALAMRVNYAELSGLKSMTLFAIDDESMFLDGGGGHVYLAEMGSHIVANRVLTGEDLTGLPRGTALPAMTPGRYLVVTGAGDGGPLAPLMINYVKVRRFDMLVNKRIAVHAVPMPFRHVDIPVPFRRVDFPATIWFSDRNSTEV